MKFASCITEHEARECGVQFTTLDNQSIVVTRTKTFWFWIRRKHGGQLERVSVQAKSDWAAIDKLPKCVYWDLTTAPSK